jgi:hypothetical protein
MLLDDGGLIKLSVSLNLAPAKTALKKVIFRQEDEEESKKKRKLTLIQTGVQHLDDGCWKSRRSSDRVRRRRWSSAESVGMG